MGMLARMAQATFILGRVLRFQARDSAAEDAALRHSERVQLDKTLRALLNLVYLEGSIQRVPVCAQSSICYRSAITSPSIASFELNIIWLVRSSFFTI